MSFAIIRFQNDAVWAVGLPSHQQWEDSSAERILPTRSYGFFEWKSGFETFGPGVPTPTDPRDILIPNTVDHVAASAVTCYLEANISQVTLTRNLAGRAGFYSKTFSVRFLNGHQQFILYFY